MPFATQIFSSLIIQQIQNIYVNRIDMAGELERCCASVGARIRTHPKIRVLWLVFAMGALPGMLSCVWSVTTMKANHCCLPRVEKLSPSTSFSLLSFAIYEDVLGIIFQIGFYYGDH